MDDGPAETGAPRRSKCATPFKSPNNQCPSSPNACLGKSPGHCAADCRDPVKCFNCGRLGHKAWHCASARKAAPPRRSSPPPRLDDSNFPPLVSTSMVLPGDARERPLEAYAVASTTRDMERELERLSTNAVVAWLGRDRPEVGTDVVARAFCSQFAVRPEDITVARHFPEDFFITFAHRHHRDAAVERRDFPYGNLDFRIRQWQLPTHGDNTDLKYHVRLCLEGIPLHAWNESIAKRVVASSCDLHYVEEQSLRREDTRAFNLWSWTANPSFIPKVTWLSLTGRTASGGSPRHAPPPPPPYRAPGSVLPGHCAPGPHRGPAEGGWVHPSAPRLQVAPRSHRWLALAKRPPRSAADRAPRQIPPR
ncbi:hypothetical protein PVAP13_3NG131801 [Panicum virgatum]|uniref:CCHC-type domain-containing protein n=1 Tax=Panicum virgatum TaxID=38727 RepID=A0A8T0UG12_PANVG|nr:hypothetical protein PVAP13_3NG131801 [Panicum virgatum]